MPRPLVAALGWLAATAVAVAVAYAGVSAVAGGVVDPLPATLGLQGVATSSEVAPSPSPVPSDAGAATPPADDGSPGVAPTAPATAPPTGGSPPAPPTTATPDPQPEAPADEVRTYSLVGGTATLRFTPGAVVVVSAHPNPGFTQEVEGDGTAEVTVQFESEHHRSRLRGSWEGGPRDRVEEDDDRGDDDHDEPDDDGDDGE